MTPLSMQPTSGQATPSSPPLLIAYPLKGRIRTEEAGFINCKMNARTEREGDHDVEEHVEIKQSVRGRLRRAAFGKEPPS